MDSAWLPYLVTVIASALTYLGGRYQARQTAVTTVTTAEQDRLDKRDERLWKQLEAENARLIIENSFWRDKYHELQPITDRSLTLLEHSPKEPT